MARSHLISCPVQETETETVLLADSSMHTPVEIIEEIAELVRSPVASQTGYCSDPPRRGPHEWR